nr:site-specific integrase [Phyllobacterium pellucidum]
MRNEDIAKYIEHHGQQSKAVLGLAILMYTGMRVSDLATIGPQHRRGDTLIFRVFKNRNKSPTTLEIPIHPILDAVMALHPQKRMTYMVTEYGKPFTIKGLGNRVSDWFTQAGLPHLTAHSVRKGLATNMAENEATDLMLEGMFGWKDAKTSKIYTRNAQRARLARQAVSKIDWGEMGNIVPHPEGGVVSQSATPEKKIS